MKNIAVLDGLEEDVGRFVSRLQKTSAPGRYFLCFEGKTAYAERAELGWSCLALKIYHSFGWWNALSETEQSKWKEHIDSFIYRSDDLGSEFQNAFIDPALIDYLRRPSLSRFISKLRSTSIEELRKISSKHHSLKPYQRAIIAETKQALATLSDVGESSKCDFHGYPKTSGDVHRYMRGFDWSLPWGAGGQTAALSVFLCLQAPAVLTEERVDQLRNVMRGFYDAIVDKETGAYFKGTPPRGNMLINGAMKVLTALDWIGQPIHYPEKLIDTVLHRLPHPRGCDLVDAVYVLYRCSLQVDYRRKSIEEYLLKCALMIGEHQQADGGFSYSVDQAQMWYYGMPVSRGLKESDLHGTVLLVWALTMIVKIVNPNYASWNIIRP